jgi:uncharacterized membrane protein YraQ (UPF0718 family)
METIIGILDYIIESFLHSWPYLLISIPIAVAVQMSGASKYISRAFSAKPILAIFLATFVGAFSPLCSCSVVPVVAAMLIGGIPLAPVMSFWLASPSMDPEIFFLTVSSLGWDLAVWRLASTLVLSLSGGLITHALIQNGWLGKNILRERQTIQVKNYGQIFKEGLQAIKARMARPKPLLVTSPALSVEAASCSDPGCSAAETPTVHATAIASSVAQPLPVSQTGISKTSSKEDDPVETPFWVRLAQETWAATAMVVKFMLLAWFIGGLIRLYVPEEWITRILGSANPWSILTGAALGIPVYTSNLAAMSLVSGLLAQGMHPPAALAFLIAGPMTTLPAMSAVWGLVNRKVFAIYIAFALIGAVTLGYVYFFVLGI